jgi:hypothetical protein
MSLIELTLRLAQTRDIFQSSGPAFELAHTRAETFRQLWQALGAEEQQKEYKDYH